ncbi:MAG: type II toxin-antitoxin system RelE/ParE family toxin [Bacillota bacterium]
MSRQVKYLPLALQDLEQITVYISNVLKAPKAALDFINAFDRAISQLQQFPYSGKIYRASQKLDKVYRVISVKSYLVFYDVTENEVEICRVIYARMRLDSILTK